jgi:hypothetical protein
MTEKSRNIQAIKTAQTAGNASRRLIKTVNMIDYYDKSISSKELQSHLSSLQHNQQR